MLDGGCPLSRNNDNITLNCPRLPYHAFVKNEENIRRKIKKSENNKSQFVSLLWQYKSYVNNIVLHFTYIPGATWLHICTTPLNFD